MCRLNNFVPFCVPSLTRAQHGGGLVLAYVRKMHSHRFKFIICQSVHHVHCVFLIASSVLFTCQSLRFDELFATQIIGRSSIWTK
jgi:hypothetical protein